MHKTKASYYIGIDPSLAKTGVGILLVRNGTTRRYTYCVKSVSSHPKTKRIALMRDEIAYRIDSVCSQKKLFRGACIEGPSHHSTGRHDDLGQVRGALSLWLYDQFGLPTEIPPASLKKYATKNGGASKEKMIECAIKLGWDIPKGEDDQGDAAHLAEMAQAINDPDNVRLNRKQLEVLLALNQLEAIDERP